MFEENDRIELVEDAVYYLDGPSAAPVALPKGSKGTVQKVVFQPQLTFEAVGVKFDDVETPIVFVKQGQLFSTLDRIQKVV